ncbi:hypothetical protein IV203_028959 [Nitzschia inconspicua]|uniref:Homologous-pairing protein 2 winged helix domain-containing protein n=1 Tax=Nitzschia inconspicua TaxID=303405 RepID=A0A9K3LPQ0_9STRA|nr:hypothetical protein IV203_028959 [Nitzschia inconspicua]
MSAQPQSPASSSGSSSAPTFQSPGSCSSNGSLGNEHTNAAGLDHFCAAPPPAPDDESGNDTVDDFGLSTQISTSNRTPRKRSSPGPSKTNNTASAVKTKKRKVSMSPTDTLAKASTHATAVVSKGQDPKVNTAATKNPLPPQDDVVDLVDLTVVSKPKKSGSMISKEITGEVTATKQSRNVQQVEEVPSTITISTCTTSEESTNKKISAGNVKQASKKPSATKKANTTSKTKNKETVEGATNNTQQKESAKPKGKSHSTGTTDKVATSSQAAEPSTKPAKSATATAAKQKAKPKKKTFEEDLLNILFVSCQPYTIKDLANAMGPSASETSVNYCLLSLIDKQWVIRKEFQFKNRTKELVWANQECRNRELVDKLHFVPIAEIAEARKELAGLQQQQKAVDAELSTVLAQPSNEELSLQCQAAEARVQELKTRLDAVKQRIASGTVLSTASQQGRGGSFGMKKAAPAKKLSPLQLKKKINGMRDEWRKRKIKCNDFVEQLADGMDKKVKDVVKLLELETDEMLGVKMPAKYDI